MKMLDALVARWRDYQTNVAGLREIEACSPEMVAQMAADLGITRAELEEVVSHGAGADRLMPRMIAAFGLDADELARTDPAAIREMAVLCSCCETKGRCVHELDAGTAAEHAEEFCPNASTFALYVEEKLKH